MSNEGKKIAFSFSKVKKPALINKVNVEPKEKIDYVDCFDGSKGKFSFKGSIKNDEETKRELVIPMPVSRTSTDMVKSRIEEKANKNLLSSRSNETGEKNPEEKKESLSQSQNLEELAAREILNEIRNGSVDEKPSNKLIIESKDVPKEASEHDIDYDNIPVTDFGLAMLRGMGWKPGLGIGKDPRLVEAASPKLRPKGLGLGATPTPEANNEKHDKHEKTSKEKERSIKRDEKSSSSTKKSHRH